MSFSLIRSSTRSFRSIAIAANRAPIVASARFYADKSTDKKMSEANQEAGDMVKKAGQAFQSDGAVGSQFNSDGNIGQVGQAVGGPFAADGAIGKNFTDTGSVGGSVQKNAEEVEGAGKEHKKQQ
ncbi:hypothetical protein IAT40_006510 [Kwoniella sp. CBS 6097]